jgi:putative hydrolase of the HAD superfamily
MLKYILFDLDNTLYPRSLGIFDLVIERIRNYMEVRMGFDRELARSLRQEYLRKYGSTMRGLMIHYNLNADDFLEYVHDVGVEKRLSPDPDLEGLLKSITVEKGIFTSGHKPHAQRVLRCLGVERYFPQIFDILFTRCIPKPNPEPYRQVLDHLCLQGQECMMIEDMPANLKPAKDLGMTTVLIGETPGGIGWGVDYEIREIQELRTVFDWMALKM